ncbi:RNA polymerase sigma-70 factor [Pararcticibacter amylolyticus]|uniref:RNA polymerase sigma-70 factor n=1 Tax=Pararcticibacter amylolyticus TaxID=2173175 RepID=A0A2U2PA56_9SPHI|nr:RNA polymerase sigma-70 factor [Pararcticibacter amylolyticus]PWG78184.1 RNA polymerase sigma-70 factor [Pararcticibacter amylolyticus]
MAGSEIHDDVLAYKVLFESHYPRLCDFAMRFVNDPDTAEDIVQDVFVAYLERRSMVSGRPESIKSFLYNSVKNACLNAIRDSKVAGKYEANHGLPSIEEKHALNMMVHSEVIGEIHQALSRLPDGCSMVIRLGFFEGLNNPQIAQKLRISVNTVKSQKQRALSLLRDHLSPQALVLLLPLLFF